MKQTYYFMAALFALCLVLAAPAAFAQGDESAAGDQPILTIQDAKALDNGAEIAIKVIVTKGLGAGKVAVEDDTGAMRAKVDKDLWPDGKFVTTNILVRSEKKGGGSSPGWTVVLSQSMLPARSLGGMSPEPAPSSRQSFD